uniref:Uncharacterized protein n=1 Tax=Lactuca sativa TaxID=4236 RepID=A0A9R1UTU0_LACSA|nr:hypothetical protein LSAT_V11C800388610 [Lactuca sativa]
MNVKVFKLNIDRALHSSSLKERGLAYKILAIGRWNEGRMDHWSDTLVVHLLFCIKTIHLFDFISVLGWILSITPQQNLNKIHNSLSLMFLLDKT